MPKDLTDAEHTQLVAALHALRTGLGAQLDSETGDGKPVELDTAIGRLSRMDAIQQQQMTKATRQRAQLRLQMVEAALLRVDDGEYGDCRRCDDPIGFGRLKAQPETPNCVKCQGALEKTR